MDTDPFTEEVYFGKAKDVVGELRSTFLPLYCVTSRY